jgi:hypothetical protein
MTPATVVAELRKSTGQTGYLVIGWSGGGAPPPQLVFDGEGGLRGARLSKDGAVEISGQGKAGLIWLILDASTVEEAVTFIAWAASSPQVSGDQSSDHRNRPGMYV